MGMQSIKDFYSSFYFIQDVKSITSCKDFFNDKEKVLQIETKNTNNLYPFNNVN